MSIVYKPQTQILYKCITYFSFISKMMGINNTARISATDGSTITSNTESGAPAKFFKSIDPMYLRMEAIKITTNNQQSL